MDGVGHESEIVTQDMPEVIYSEYADDSDLVDLIDEFVAGLEGDIKSMRRALESSDHDRLRRLAHHMKGAGGSYGYQVLTEAGKILEGAAKVPDVQASLLALNKFTILSQAIARGRNIRIGVD